MQAVKGDLAKPRLGLTQHEFERLGRSVTEIVHGAADIRFHLPLEAARCVNVEGTAALLTHISTVYIMGRDEGLLPETQYRNSSGFVNTYQQSKYGPEEAVCKAMREIPTAIVRLSYVVGHSVTGCVRRRTTSTRACEAFRKVRRRYCPGQPERRLT